VQDARRPSPWQPFAIAIALLTVYAVLFVGGGLAGWWEPAANEQPIGEVSRWCERVSGGILREPINTLGNLAFVLAGLTMLVILARDQGRHDASRRTRAADWPNPFTGNQGMALLYAGTAIFLGPGSMLMHGSHTFAGAWLDNVSMVAYILVPTLYNLRVLAGWSGRVFAVAYCTVLAAYAIGYWVLGSDLGINLDLFAAAIPVWLISETLVRFRDPRYRWASGLLGFAVAAAFGVWPTTIATNLADYWWIVLFWLPALLDRGRVAVRRRYLPWFPIGVASFLGAFYIWSLGKDGTSFCRPDSLLQGHAAWHILCALATFAFFLFLRTQRAQEPAAGAVEPDAQAAAHTAAPQAEPATDATAAAAEAPAHRAGNAPDDGAAS
jgi:hypothetical protein